ncbi:MAG: ABC transporter permease [Chloroflexi bacterium]|nr:ABC transporter permease [Chloroflexota bacterium]
MQSIVILWAISLIAFVIMHLAPGGPGAIYEDPTISPEATERIRESFGLNDPILTQYVRWLGSILQGDFGRSFVDSRPVLGKISERIPATIQLNVAARLLGLLGIPLGIYSAVRRNRFIDHFIRILLSIGSAAPHWWIGLMFLVFVAAPTGWLPLGGMYTIGKQEDLLDRIWHLVLPATMYAFGDWIVWSRYLRSEIFEVLNQDYVRTAHAKGLTGSRILTRHVLRNAMIPVITIFGGSFATIISGSVALETVFSWPGIGRLAYTASIQRDYPVIMALILISSLLVMLGNLLLIWLTHGLTHV